MKGIIDKIRKNEGITVAALTVTIMILIIVTAAMAVNINTRYQAQELDKLSTDLQLLEDKVLLYYTEHGEYPIKSDSLSDEECEIDLSKLSGITLNYGSKEEGENDIYVVNRTNGVISYKKGISYNGEMIYSFSNSESEIEGITMIKIENQSVEIKDSEEKVVETITLTKSTQTISVQMGETATLSVNTNLSKEDGISYQWYKNEEKIPNAQENRLEITELEEGATYYCQITSNTEGVQERKSNIVVISVEK